MKTIKLMIIIFLLSVSSSVFAGEEIKITIGEWSPFISEELPHYGIVPHLISDIFNEAGVKVEYGFFPWARSSYLVKVGEWHASAIWGITEERKKHFNFSDVVYTGETVLFYHKDHPIVWTGNLEDLKGLRIGLILGAAKSNILKEAEKKGFITYDIGGDEVMTFLKLLEKRFHAIDKNKAVGLHAIQTRLSSEQRTKIGYTKPHELWDYHLIFSKKLKENEKFLEIFNKGLYKMKKNGRFDEMWKAFYRGEYNP
jgi:polar amino acid transport system substrate-binding protein